MNINLTRILLLALVFLWLMMAIWSLMGCTTSKPVNASQYKVVKIVAKDKDGNVSTKYVGQIK